MRLLERLHNASYHYIWSLADMAYVAICWRRKSETLRGKTAVLLPLSCLCAQLNLVTAQHHKQPMVCLTAAGLPQPVETRDCRVLIPFASSHWGSPVSRLGMAYLQGVSEVQQSQAWWIYQLGQRSVSKSGCINFAPTGLSIYSFKPNTLS